MRMRGFPKHVFWLVVIGAIWLWGAKIWYDRARVVFAPDRSAFWKKVTLPTDVEIAAPAPSTRCLPVSKVATDDYSKSLLVAAGTARSSHVTAKCDITALNWLNAHEPARLRRYLACHPGWRFARANNGDLARRRILKNGQWHEEEWCVKYDIEESDEDGDGYGDDIESSCEIDFAPREFYGAQCRLCGNVALELKPADDDWGNREAVCFGDGLMLDVVEWSSFTTCRVAQTIFDLTKVEFEKVRDAANEQVMKGLLPVGAARRGPAALDLFEERASEGELMSLDYQAWINPGESGETYLRAFEVSQGVEIGNGTDGRTAYLVDDTREYAGWSEDREEKFLIGSQIRFSGVKGKILALRFEVWFRSANGGPERKLVERVFKIDRGVK